MWREKPTLSCIPTVAAPPPHCVRAAPLSRPSPVSDLPRPSLPDLLSGFSEVSGPRPLSGTSSGTDLQSCARSPVPTQPAPSVVPMFLFPPLVPCTVPCARPFLVPVVCRSLATTHMKTRFDRTCGAPLKVLPWAPRSRTLSLSAPPAHRTPGSSLVPVNSSPNIPPWNGPVAWWIDGGWPGAGVSTSCSWPAPI